MKTRFVKLLGLLTVLMVPVGLWLTWPYWHPMWWNPKTPPVSFEEIRRSVVSERERIGETSNDVQTLAWSDIKDNQFNSLRCIYVCTFQKTDRTHAVLVYQFSDGDWSVHEHGSSSVVDSSEFERAFAGWHISPHAWKRVTSEVLTPSRLKELQGGGFELP